MRERSSSGKPSLEHISSTVVLGTQHKQDDNQMQLVQRRASKVEQVPHWERLWAWKGESSGGDLSAAFRCLQGGHQEGRSRLFTAVQQDYMGNRCRELDTAFSNMVSELALSKRTPEIPPNLNLPGFL